MTVTKKEKNLGGRPTKFSAGLAHDILEYIRQGGWLEDLADGKLTKFPTRTCVYKWLADEDKAWFSEAYAQALETRAQFYVKKAVSVVEDDSKDRYEDGDRVRADHAAVQRSKLKADMYKWLAEKHCPKMYAQKIEQEIYGKNGAPILPVIEIVQHKKGD